MIKRLFFFFYRKKITKFGIVGSLGAVTNLGLFFLFADLIKFPATPVSIGTFIISVTQNYFLNHFWTFRVIIKDDPVSVKGYLKFITTSLVGLGVKLVILNLILYFFNPPYKVIAEFFGIFGGMFFNFLGSKYFVFKQKKQDESQT